MKLVSQRGVRVSPAVPPRRRLRFPVTRWIRARSGLERALFVKALLTLLVAAIAIYAVHPLAHTMQALEQSVGH